MAASEEKLRRKVGAAFKMHGLLLRAEATKYLTEALQTANEVELEDMIENIIDAVEKQPLSCNMIEKSMVEAAVLECSQSVDETMEHVFNIIGAFDIPRYVYSSERKKFLPLSMTNHPAPNLFGSARDKAELFRERHIILQQRTHRHELFTPSAIGALPDESRSKFQLKTVETLLGNSAKVGDVIVLGMITQMKEVSTLISVALRMTAGKFFLEDPTGVVQLDISKAISFTCFTSSLTTLYQFHSGLYTESCFVLTEGWYEDEVFHVNAFGFPPTEPSATTRAYYGNANFFGGPSSTSVKASAKLKQLEEENEDAMFVFLSDVWLDQADVLEKLRMMFSGYASMPPTCFFFCGNFSSAPYGKNHIQTMKGSLKALADIICEFPSIHERPPLSESITEEFRQQVPFSVFTTNPCRVQYCTQEIIIFREDLVNKMCRNCIRFPSSNLDIPNHGSFPRSGFSFKVFYPSNKTVEDSKLQGL
ncbi:hypothetical protein JD844_020253 [Phrynosoma platyrhinos]|uniref:DNA polymerase II subunit 2 n=1 Tax=Phrynosoma platyrhinos TaxID=52577 RepID=A0ABQ7SS97_PHRPL|nr:hypothetical protein JD844_020253 [Phrynosoma platyrhinos]